MYPMIKQPAVKPKGPAGFTLIEMAIVVMIIGIAIGAFAPAYKAYIDNKELVETKSNIEDIAAAIGSFRSINGRYPFPASLSEQHGDVDYGREKKAVATAGVGSFDPQGFYLEEGVRSFNYTSPFAGPVVNGKPRVRVGFVPFRQLHLSENSAYDGYGNRIMYAITEHLADSETFRANEGGIEILDSQGDSVVNAVIDGTPVTGTAHFLIFSYGKNTKGAYSRNGTAYGTCPANGDMENENCNLTDPDAIFRLSQTNTSATDSSFDDVVSYFTQSEVPLWQYSANAANPYAIHQKPGGEVGMAAVAPDALLKKRGDINGANLRAKDDPATPAPALEGKIMSSMLCDGSGNIGPGHCFTVNLIAGEDDPATPAVVEGGMHCPGDDPDGVGSTMVGIANGAPICDEIDLRCPGNSIVTGINPDGTLDCSVTPVGPCDTDSYEICPSTIATRTGGPIGTIRNVTGGDNRNETWQCQDAGGPKGSWVRIGDFGSCVCTPGSNSYPRACGTGFTGGAIETCSRVCPSGAVSCTNDRETACVCTPTFEDRIDSCPAGLNTGFITSRRNWVCDSPTSGHWTGYTEISNTCACTEGPPATGQGPCDHNFTGSVYYENPYSCSASPPGYQGWREVSRDCRCTEDRRYQYDACPAGKIGSMYREYHTHVNGNGDCVTDVTPISDTCADPPPVICSWRSTATMQPSESGGSPRLGDSGCTCGSVAPRCYSGSMNNFRSFSPCTCE